MIIFHLKGDLDTNTPPPQKKKKKKKKLGQDKTAKFFKNSFLIYSFGPFITTRKFYIINKIMKHQSGHCILEKYPINN